jgi:hypothetical protein
MRNGHRTENHRLVAENLQNYFRMIGRPGSGRSKPRGMSMSLPSGTDWCFDSTVGQAARIFVLSLALGVATQASAGPSSEQAKPGRATCFFNEIHHPQAGDIAKATVFIAGVASDGTLASEGTGFVVSDSADGDTQGSRIVTAAHVIEDIERTRDGERWAVFFSDGMPLGEPRKVVRGKPRELSVGGFDLVENDIAVIEITSFNNVAARDRFIALQGLPLTGAGDILVGESSQPPGVSWGFSGAAAIDPGGRVAGVLTGAEFRDRMTLELGSILDADPNGGAVSRPVILPGRSLVVIEPLSDPDILRVLGRSPGLRGSGLRTTVTIAGFPAASCAATSATVEPIDSQAGTRLLSQWRSIGMEGAWYLPPQLGTTKFLPVVKAP